MVKYCSECGNEIEAGFKFCPECGKKNIVRPTSCPDCGAKLKEKFKFCPECGKDIMPPTGKAKAKPKKVETTPPEKKVEEIKPAKKTIPEKNVKSKATKPKISLSFLSKFKRPGKKVIMIFSIICIVLLVSAAIVLYYPFNSTDTNGTSSEGRTFIISIDNNYAGGVSYYLKIGMLRYGSGTDTLLSNGETQTLEIDEDSLNPGILNSEYDITLYVSTDDGASYLSDFALDVTEFATFVISSIGQVNCTESQ